MALKVLFPKEKNLLRYDDMSRDFGMSEAHFHNFYEVYFLVNGKCRFSVENHIYDINKNDMLIIPPGQVHMANDYFGMSNRIIIVKRKIWRQQVIVGSLNYAYNTTFLIYKSSVKLVILIQITLRKYLKLLQAKVPKI